MFRKEFWITFFHLIYLIKEVLRKDSSYDIECICNSVLDCTYDLYAWRHYGCWYWQVVENEKDRNK